MKQLKMYLLDLLFLAESFFRVGLVGSAKLKKLLTCSLLLMSFSATAEIVSTPRANITGVAGYDDFAGGALFVFLDKNHPACPDGAYIKPDSVTSPGWKTLVALALSALMASKPVVLQLYTDRIQASRCEVDAVLVFPS